MKLYRHYKNKLYKYITTARHSETEEELVIYQTRYGDSGIWVRPKAMFFESVDLNGKTIPRFAQVPLEIVETSEVTEASVQIIAPVMEQAFGQWDSKWFFGRFKNHTKFHLLTAAIDGQIVAFKLGYEQNSREFYSWLGGVIPDFRGAGIAAELMKRQHEWCRKQGYARVQTKTQNRFREMFILNLKHGFEVTGTAVSSDGGLKIILEKRL